jgi:hypothetical protein
MNIRKAALQDVPAWLDLLKTAVGEDYPDPRAYEPAWAADQLQETGGETWIAEADGVIYSSISFLLPFSENQNPVANIGRHLNRPESYSNGAASGLMQMAAGAASERKQLLISRVLGSDQQQQLLYETAGFSCVGFQPFKHTYRVREGVLFYYRVAGHDISKRLPISESLPQVSELAALVLGRFNLPAPGPARDGATGYPLQSELEFSEGTRDDFELWKLEAQGTHPAVELSGAHNQGVGFLRTANPAQPRALIGARAGSLVAALLYSYDSVDRCARLLDSFSRDDLSLGPVLNQLVKHAREQLSAIYVEMDVLAIAPRLLKSAEQIGFVPVSYLPAVYWKDGSHVDVVKMVKLNLVYSLDNVSFTAQAKCVADVIDQNFQDQKMGVAIINLLRTLPFFEGLGDGELRKIARLFTQKLYRAGEPIFAMGDLGNEAYVVMRGQIDIQLDQNSKPLAQFGNGQIFGELAFLDGTPRAAMAVASQPSILLVIQRSAFSDLARREPHLGMVVMRNIALELSNRLRKANQVISHPH